MAPHLSDRQVARLEADSRPAEHEHAGINGRATRLAATAADVDLGRSVRQLLVKKIRAAALTNDPLGTRRDDV